MGLAIMGVVDILLIISIGSFRCSQACADYSSRFFLDAAEEAGGSKGRSQPVMAAL